MNQALLIGGLAVAIGPVRRAIVRPAAKVAVKGALNVADAATGTVKGIGDVYTEAREEHRGGGTNSSRPARKTAAKA